MWCSGDNIVDMINMVQGCKNKSGMGPSKGWRCEFVLVL